MTRRGFVLGKFMPPHLGHTFLCESAQNMVDELSVLVCSLSQDPISGDLRAQWMRELLPRAHILHLDRDIPQTPEEHPEFWSIWTRTIKEFHPNKIDFVFGSEPYVFDLACHLEAEPILIDPERHIFNVSATAIRSNVYDYWEHVPSIVKPYYAKRICVLGPESSGKSTLVEKLAKRFKTCFMPEYGRTYDEHYKQAKTCLSDGIDRKWRSSELLRLAKTHIAMRDVLMKSANRLLFEDTDIIQTLIWERHLIGSHSEAMLRLVEDQRLADYYIILGPSESFVDDGGRYYPDRKTRMEFFEEAINAVKTYNCAHTIIDEESRALRDECAILAVESFVGFIPNLD